VTNALTLNRESVEHPVSWFAEPKSPIVGTLSADHDESPA
jgi:hypothetical protein